MQRKPTVYIVGGQASVAAMFINYGWEISKELATADLIQFTGGADIYPGLYGHGVHKRTAYNLERDRKEELVFRMALLQKTPMAGICRGGQLINALCGGTMWQDVDGHNNGWHEVIDSQTGERFNVNSIHHQMMIPGKTGLIIAAAHGVARIKEKVLKDNSSRIDNNHKTDPEIIIYEHAKCLCFQPHPEFTQIGSELQNRYFDYIADYLNIRGNKN